MARMKGRRPERRQRFQITLSLEARKQAEEIAQADRRNFSNTLEWLVQCEHQRRKAA